MFSNRKMKLYLSIFLLTLISCDGTLGGFNTIRFPISKKKVELAFDSLYATYPEYKIPDKLEEYNFWSKSGYDFLDSRLIYFSEFPEELYYVSFIGEEQTFKDTSHIDIAIRSVFVDSKKKWLKQKDFSKEEEIRVQARFKSKIISKIEKFTNTKSIDLDN